MRLASASVNLQRLLPSSEAQLPAAASLLESPDSWSLLLCQGLVSKIPALGLLVQPSFEFPRVFEVLFLSPLFLRGMV